VGKRIDFANQLETVPSQLFLKPTSWLTVFIPVKAKEGTSKLAYCDNTLLTGTGK